MIADPGGVAMPGQLADVEAPARIAQVAVELANGAEIDADLEAAAEAAAEAMADLIAQRVAEQLAPLLESLRGDRRS